MTKEFTITRRHRTQGLWLHIDEVTFTDDGVYECFIVDKSTGNGNVIRRLSTLVVKGPPLISEITVVRQARTALLSVTIYGNPPPTIEWTRNGDPVQMDARVSLLPNGTLKLCEVGNEDAGDYVVTARNSYPEVALQRVPCCNNWQYHANSNGGSSDNDNSWVVPVVVVLLLMVLIVIAVIVVYRYVHSGPSFQRLGAHRISSESTRTDSVAIGNLQAVDADPPEGN